MAVDPETEVTVTCGATEAMVAALLALVDPGDEVIVFEPFYENYGPDAILCDAAPGVRAALPRPAARPRPAGRRVRAADPRDHREYAGQSQRPGVHPRGARGDRRAVPAAQRLGDHRRDLRAHPLRAASTSPSPPCRAWRERTITISGASKTFSITGWRIGTIVAPAGLDRRDPQGARLPHRRRAGAAAGGAGRRDGYLGPGLLRRDGRASTCAAATCCTGAVVAAGFKATAPEGAYYILADFSEPLRPATTPRSRTGSRGSGRGAGAGLELLQPAGAGPHATCVSSSARPTICSAKPRRGCWGRGGGRPRRFRDRETGERETRGTGERENGGDGLSSRAQRGILQARRGPIGRRCSLQGIPRRYAPRDDNCSLSPVSFLFPFPFPFPCLPSPVSRSPLCFPPP